MSVRFITIDRKSPMLMPPSLQEWLPENHIARLIVQIVESLPLSAFRVNWRGTGDAQVTPAMLLAQRKARLEQARQMIEERYEQERRNAQEQVEAKVAERQAKREAGKPPRGREPEPPAATPPAKKQ